MPFSNEQRQALKAKLRFRHVKSREASGAKLSYIEGWHSIAEANRIFGFDSWDRKTLLPRCLWRETLRGHTLCLYTTKVRITVRAGGCEIVREGIGTGSGRATAPEVAHEMALKAAETDATKRALATFGNPFGLALYDKDQAHVTKPAARPDPPPLGASPAASKGPGRTDSPPDAASSQKAAANAHEETNGQQLVLRVNGSADRSFAAPEAFQAAALDAITSLPTLETLYAFWEQNLGSFRILRDGHMPGQAPASDRYAAIRIALQTRARAIADLTAPSASTSPVRNERDAALLAIPKEKRIRDKAHLAFVAEQPCLVCGRAPAQAHHLKFAQSRSMGLKVSDEFTLPLCNIHHDQLHRSGDERAWWARSGIIDPLKLAARLWAASRGHVPADSEDDRDNGRDLANGAATIVPGSEAAAR